MSWMWQLKQWPEFHWHKDRLRPKLDVLHRKQGQLSALVKLDADERHSALDVLLETIIASSAIEGERLDRDSVRSSLANKLGLIETNQTPGLVTDKSNGVANLVLDAVSNPDRELTAERLYTWHRWLFPENEFRLEKIDIGKYRPKGQMQIVSGPSDRPVVHFEAPPAETVPAEMNRFLQWFNDSAHDRSISAFERAALAHLWFEVIHPFDDGNGRIGRAISDLALAQGDAGSVRAFSMSSAILQDRKGYYRAIENSHSGSMSVDDWMSWFLSRLDHAMDVASERANRTLDKARYWDKFKETALLPEQRKALNKLLDGVFPQGLSAKKYSAFTGVSKPTATRHLADLVRKGCVEKQLAGGRSTTYQIVPVAHTTALGPDKTDGIRYAALPLEDLPERQHEEYRMIGRQISIAEKEILKDMEEGRMPADRIRSFEDLNDHVDANMYLSDVERVESPIADYCAENGFGPQGVFRIAGEIAEPLDKWLLNGRQGNALDYLVPPRPAQFYLSTNNKSYPVEDLAHASELFLSAYGLKDPGKVLLETPKGDLVGTFSRTGQVLEATSQGQRILYQPGVPEPLRISESTGERDEILRSLKRYPDSYLLAWEKVTAEDLEGRPTGQAGSKGIARREVNLGLQVIRQELSLRGHTFSSGLRPANISTTHRTTGNQLQAQPRPSVKFNKI